MGKRNSNRTNRQVFCAKLKFKFVYEKSLEVIRLSSLYPGYPCRVLSRQAAKLKKIVMDVRNDKIDEINSTWDDTIASDIFNQAIHCSEDETLFTRDSSQFGDTIVDLKNAFAMENHKPKIVTDEILVDRYDLRAIKAVSSRKETIKEKSFKRIHDSGLWSPLMALDDSLNTPDKNVLMNDEDMIGRLNERFSISPRTFTESLITIIEESFNQSHQKLDEASKPSSIDLSKNKKVFENISPMNNSLSHTFQKFLKKSKIEKGLLANESPPKSIIVTPTENQISVNFYRGNIASDISADESTRYLELPEIKVTTSTVEISSIKNKIFTKTPKIIVNPATPKKIAKTMPKSRSIRSPAKVLREKTSKAQGKLEEHVQTARLRKKSSHLLPLNSDDNDEYLTAESETDESEISRVSTVSTENTKESSSAKVLNMSKIATEHQNWLMKFEQISQNQFVPHKSSIVEGKKTKLSTYSNKLEQRYLKELNEKRRKCFDLVDEMLQKPVVKQPKAGRSCTEDKLTEEFCNVLLACANFCQYARTVNEMCDCKKNTERQYATSTTMHLKTRKSISSPGAARTTMKTRKSVSKSPGARIIATRSPGLTSSSMKRKTSKKPKSSPAVDATSIRPVSQLRRIYSPNPKTTRYSESNENKWKKPKTTGKTSAIVAEKKVTVQFVAKRDPFKEIVSPVGEYIRR